eukprot:3390334-Prymnesium_polylepis.3
MSGAVHAEAALEAAENRRTAPLRPAVSRGIEQCGKWCSGDSPHTGPRSSLESCVGRYELVATRSHHPRFVARRVR